MSENTMSYFLNEYKLYKKSKYEKIYIHNKDKNKIIKVFNKPLYDILINEYIKYINLSIQGYQRIKDFYEKINNKEYRKNLCAIYDIVRTVDNYLLIIMENCGDSLLENQQTRNKKNIYPIFITETNINELLTTLNVLNKKK